MNTQLPHKCAQCGSALVLISSETVIMEGNKFPQTTQIYRCADEICQENMDNEKNKRLKLKKDREIAELAKQKKRKKNTYTVN